ncbi:MAG: response regulator transcription factor [Chloroflexi bacterium]|nr:response regulator transcription factor [Chloroflexota bacterium]
MTTIRILICDDHEVVRKGLALVLRQEPDFEIVGEAQDGQETLKKVRDLTPDLVLLDWKMPGMDGITTARTIRQQEPGVRVLVLSGAPVEDAVLDSLNAGIDGFVHKAISPANLTLAIRVVAGGQPYLAPEVTQALLQRAQVGGEMQTVSLTPREMDVLRLMATPATYNQIGEQLSISEETVRTHAKNILTKLDQPNRTQAVIAGLRAHLISLD